MTTSGGNGTACGGDGDRGGRRRARWLAAAAAAAAAVVVLPAVGSAPQAAAEFSYLPEQARVLTLSLLPGGNDDDLHGEVCAAQRSCSPVPYPYLLRSQGVDRLDTALRQPMPDPGQSRQIVFGYSQGARVAANWIAEYGGTEGAPSPENLSFVLIGNPGRKHGGAHVDWGQVVPDSEYEVLDVARQYDLAADFPDKLNLLALANAFAGFTFVHPNYEEVDLYDPANYVWREGRTTYVFIPTENLPLLEPLRWIGLIKLADALNGPLKEIVESAYDRSYLPAQPGMPTEPDPEPEPEPEPEDPPADPGPEEPPAEPAPEGGADTVDAARTAPTAQFVSTDEDRDDLGRSDDLGDDEPAVEDEEIDDTEADDTEIAETEIAETENDDAAPETDDSSAATADDKDSDGQKSGGEDSGGSE